MKARLLTLAALLLLVLAACTPPPITIGLSDVKIDLSVAVDSAGKVIFPESPLELKNPLPGTSVASVTVRGEARLEQAATLSFDVYATDTDPGESGLGCPKVGTMLTGYFYVCDPDTEGVVMVSKNTIAFNNQTGPVSFTLSGEVLASGINKQTLYLGAVISGGSAGNTLYLENLTATVQLNVGK